MNIFQSLFFLIFFLSISTEKFIKYLNGTLNQRIFLNISKFDEILIFYDYNGTLDDSSYLRAFVEANIYSNSSVLIVLKDDDDQVNHIKLSKNKNLSTVNAERTICPVYRQLSGNIIKRRSLMIDISTESLDNIHLEFEIKHLFGFNVKLNDSRTFIITLMSPNYLMFIFNNNEEQVNVKVTSPDQNCMILSIQDAGCPAYDLVENVKFKGVYQSVTTSGSIIKQKPPQKNAFFIVFVLNPNDGECSRKMAELSGQVKPARNKTITLEIVKTPSIKDYFLPVFGMIGFYLAFFVIALIISFIYKHCYYNGIVLEIEERIIESPMEDPSNYGSLAEIADMNTLNSGIREVFCNRIDNGAETSSKISRVKLDSANHSYDLVSDASTDPSVYRLNISLYVSDLSRKSSAVLNRKYFLYLWYLIIISFFYALPVVQLVITYQQVVRTTGNEDVCFYNFQCTRPLYIFTAFNNIISNVGYVLLGLLFTLITCRRQRLYNECKLRRIKRDMYQGIPQYNGLFYAMGVALTMEGILSACYHICPSNNNFQFDTAYMYILACLCMIKIYQTRHPDVNASAHSFFMTMSFIIFIGVVGVVYNSLLFWIFFTILYIAISVILTLEVYYIGCWRLDTGLPYRAYQVIVRDKWLAFMPTYKRRMMILVLLNIINLIFAFYGGFAKPKDFASFFLGIFMLNLLMYFCFYIAMKMRYCEHFHILPIIYVLIAMICWSFAIYCFIEHPTDWQLTPAASREINKNCMFLDFYDIHDVWHFLSSMSMFFSFLALQNLDDSLFNVDRNKIPVF